MNIYEDPRIFWDPDLTNDQLAGLTTNKNCVMGTGLAFTSLGFQNYNYDVTSGRATVFCDQSQYPGFIRGSSVSGGVTTYTGVTFSCGNCGSGQKNNCAYDKLQYLLGT